jgi:predicted lipid-binding transport protein (Tim44 family)
MQLAETEASFSAAARLVRQTGSYPRDRAVAVAGLSALLGGALLGGVVVSAALSALVHKAVGGVAFLALCLGVALGLVPYVERRFFAMRCAFTFLVTEALLRRSAIPPTGTAEAAQRFLAGRFGDLAGPAYDAHMEVRRTVSSFFRSFDRLGDVLPLDVGPARSALGWVVDRVAPHVADVALSHALAVNAADPAAASDDAVTLVAQNPRPLLGAAVKGWLFERALGSLVGGVTLALFGAASFAAVAAAATLAASSSGVPTEGAQAAGLIAGAFAAVLVGGPAAWLATWFVRSAFLEPVSLAMLLIRYHATVQGQTVDPSIRAGLRQAQRASDGARGLASFFE